MYYDEDDRYYDEDDDGILYDGRYDDPYEEYNEDSDDLSDTRIVYKAECGYDKDYLNSFEDAANFILSLSNPYDSFSITKLNCLDATDDADVLDQWTQDFFLEYFLQHCKDIKSLQQ